MQSTTSPRAVASAPSRPSSVTWAFVLLVVLAAGNIAGPLLPGSEGEVVFGLVSAAIVAVAAAGLWALRRWGLVMTIVVAALNLLLDVPALLAPISASLKAVAVVLAIICLAVLVLATRPAARRAFQPER